MKTSNQNSSPAPSRKGQSFTKLRAKGIRPRIDARERADREVAGFNKSFPIGTKIEYFDTDYQAVPVITRTRSKAWVFPSGEPVVMIEGRAGGVALSHVSLREEDGYENE